MIKDAGRSSGTAMRDLLRRLEREVNASKPLRPTATGPTATVFAATTSAPVAVGDWLLSQDPDTGDLIATDSTTGAATTVARKGGN